MQASAWKLFEPRRCRSLDTVIVSAGHRWNVAA
jgi:hypothetical protein